MMTGTARGMLLTCAGLALTLTVGCGAEPEGETGPSETDPSVPIEVALGEEFSIRLNANATTGYAWQLGEPLDEGVLGLVGSVYEAPETELVGTGGQEVWTFSTLAAGETTVRLEYRRPSEEDATPEDSRAFTVIVSE